MKDEVQVALIGINKKCFDNEIIVLNLSNWSYFFNNWQKITSIHQSNYNITKIIELYCMSK